MSPFDSVQFDKKRAEHMKLMKNDVERLFHELKKLPPSREQSLAITKLEETAMWCNKALRAWQIQETSNGN